MPVESQTPGEAAENSVFAHRGNLKIILIIDFDLIVSVQLVKICYNFIHYI